MKKGKITLLLFIITMFLITLSAHVCADEERSIFVGDLIQLKIQSRDLSLEELKDKFKDFEIVSVTDISDGYLVTLRSFETGEKTVQLGDKEITIVVKSTLDEIERNEIYEGDTSPQKAGLYIQWKYVFYGLVVVFLLTVGINIFILLKRKKKLSLSPYQKFINGLNSIPFDWDDYCVWLTLCFKDYIEAKYSLRIRGKTSDEIIGEISAVHDLHGNLSALGTWLKECDYYKFSGNAAAVDKKQELMNRLRELLTKIEEINGEKVAMSTKEAKKVIRKKEIKNAKQVNEVEGEKETKHTKQVDEAEGEKETKHTKQVDEAEGEKEIKHKNEGEV